MPKVSIRFFDDKEIRAVWNDENSRWYFSVLDYDGIVELAKNFPNNKASSFLDCFLYSDQTIDAKSKDKAYAFFEISLKLQPQNVSTFEDCNSVRVSGHFNKSVSQETDLLKSLPSATQFSIFGS